MHFTLSHNYFVHQGDIPGELIVADQDKFYVTKQTWQGEMIVSTQTLESFVDKEDADSYCNTAEENEK